MGFSPDSPIDSPRHDRLGRKHFAKAIGKALGSWRDDQSLVIGLFGGWGTGKTSVKNLALHSLRHDAPNEPVIINFNAWMVSKQEQLAESFFRDIAVALARPIPGESQEKASKRLTKLAAFLSVTGDVSQPVLEIAGLLGVPGASLAAATAKTLSKAAKMTKQAADSQKEIAQGVQKTLSELKDDLRESLKQREEPVYIVIDDIDRLANDEICLLFRLIKANADFPRFLYILLCDRDFVTGALDILAPGRGAEFLEKIVQVSFDIPAPAWDDLIKLAWSEWSEIRKGSSDAVTRTDLSRWNALMRLSRPYLPHVRAVRRWMNAVKFSFDFFKAKSGFDANPEDLLAIELIRVFEPNLYEAVARSKSILTKERWSCLGSSPQSAERNSAIKNELFAIVPDDRRSYAVALIEWIFPNARWKHFQDNTSQLLRHLRAAEPRCFERYFCFALSNETMTRQEVKRAIGACKSRVELSKTISYQIAQGRFALLLEHLSAHIGEIAMHAKEVLHALFEVGDEMPAGRWVFGGEDLQSLTTDFVLSLMGEFDDYEKRDSLLVDATKQAKGVMIPFFVAMYATSDHYRQQRHANTWLVSDARLEEFKVAMLGKLREFEASPLLCNANNVGVVLWAWKNWAGVEEPAEWLKRQLQTPQGFWVALRSAASYEISRGVTTYTSVSVSDLRLFLGDEIVKAAEKINLKECDQEQTLLFSLFQSNLSILRAKESGTNPGASAIDKDKEGNKERRGGQ